MSVERRINEIVDDAAGEMIGVQTLAVAGGGRGGKRKSKKKTNNDLPYPQESQEKLTILLGQQQLPEVHTAQSKQQVFDVLNEEIFHFESDQLVYESIGDCLMREWGGRNLVNVRDVESPIMTSLDVGSGK